MDLLTSMEVFVQAVSAIPFIVFRPGRFPCTDSLL
jgi:hypothetical protein